MAFNEPWSKKHKRVTGGTPFSLSNSFAEPLTSSELIQLSLARGDDDLVHEYQNHSLDYTPNGGSDDLKAEIAKLYGPDISADNILIFTGAQVALQTAATAIMDEGDRAIVFGPGYQSVISAPIHAGGTITKLYRKPENNWAIEIHEVEAAITDKTKYIIVNEPYNPAGTLMKPDVQQELVDLAEKHGLYILSDEVYRLLEHDPKDRLPAMADIYDKGISACTLSKPWGGCGITIGWLATQDKDLYQKLVDTQYFGTACPSRASELQAMMVLRSSDEILEKNMKIMHHNMGLLDEFMTEHDEFFSWVRPSAGAVCYMQFKGPISSNELGAQLADAGISIKPAYVFDDEDRDEYRGYFRLGYGESKMPLALEALSNFVKENRDDWRREMSQQ